MQCLRIVIADDDHHVRAGLRAFLSSVLPCDIVGEAANGMEAIDQADWYRPDAVVLDLRMPEMDGLEVTRMIKARWPEMVVVVLTLYAEQRTAVLKAGADAFVAKGDSPDQLLHILRAIQSNRDNPRA